MAQLLLHRNPVHGWLGHLVLVGNATCSCDLCVGAIAYGTRRGTQRSDIFLVEKVSVRVISGVKPFFHAKKCRKTHCFSVSMVPSATQVGIIQSFTGFGLADGCRLSRNSFVLLPYVHKDCCEESYSTDHTGCLIGGQFSGRHGFFGVKTVDPRRMPG